MKFSEVVAQTIAWLEREGRVSYRALKREFALDDEFLEDVKAEIIDAKRFAIDEDGKVLVWVGEGRKGETAKRGNGEKEVVSSQLSVVSSQPLTPNTQSLAPSTQHSAAERRQLTVLFCDLVGSTALSTRLDPEDLREVVRQYQQTCAEVIQRHDGYIAQYLGDGLLVYFGYPTAHEDDARRAVRTGLEIVEALRRLSPSPYQGEGSTSRASAGEGGLPSSSSHSPHPSPLPQGERGLQVRIGIHTGLVVIGDVGAGGRTEQLALGETPNIAARLQGLAEPNAVLISAATQRLLSGQFESQPFGSHVLKGIDAPIAVYHVLSEPQSVSLLAGKTMLTPLVGREQEVGLLVDCWEQAKDGRGHVVLLAGEPGIGKSRLTHALQEHVIAEGSLLYEAHCSPYHQHSAFHPLIEAMQWTFALTRQETDQENVEKLERALAVYAMPASLPLFAALLSLPTPTHYPPLNLAPQKQKERTLQALVQLLVAQTERQATVSVWEDVHWADPSSLEFLSLLIEQIPTTRLLLVLTFRPEFVPPWKPRSHISHLVLNRLGQKQVETMIAQTAMGKALPPEIIAQIRLKTDGVPLFVEELTKSVIESVGSVGFIESIGSPNRTPLQLAIPATLQEALLARLDRLSTARQIAQLGATLGREFSYELLHAVAPVSDAELQAALTKLVDAEILYQRGLGEQSRYVFKHALIQDTAYQSLLKSTRQQYHQQIAQVLEERFSDEKAHQPELLAHHYTEAGLIEQAIPYWQQAGESAMQRSANAEAISYLAKGLELAPRLSETPEGTQRELVLQVALGTAAIAAKGYTAPEVERAYTRARELCQRMGETPQIFPILIGLWVFYTVRGELRLAHELADQCLGLAQRLQAQDLFFAATYIALGETSLWLGDLVSAEAHYTRGATLYSPGQVRPDWMWGDFGVSYFSEPALTLCYLGYPDKALKKSQASLARARDLAHPFSLAYALIWAALFHQGRHEGQAVQELAETGIAFATEHGFRDWLAWGTILRGWALALQGQQDEGIAQLRQGLAGLQATGVRLLQPYALILLAEACEKAGQTEAGLSALAEARDVMHKTDERFYEAELYRLKGELLLQQARQQGTAEGQQGRVPDP